MNLDPAVEHVRARGTTLEQARLRYLLEGVAAPRDIVDQFTRSQRSDGGWSPFWAPDYSSVDATAFQLALAEQAGVERFSPIIIDGARFLIERQRADGSWEEEAAEATNAPFWAAPGDPQARLYLTANAGYWLAASGHGPAGARDAARYLDAQRGESGRLASFNQTHWLAAGLWQRLGMVEAAGSSLDALAEQLPDLSAGNLAWMLITLLSSGVPANQPVVEAALARLEVLRTAEGYWPEDEEAGNSAHVTLEALRAMKLASQ